MTTIGRGLDVSSDPHVAYYTPSGLLPFGIEVAAGYAPNTTDGQGNSYKNAGVQADKSLSGTDATQYKLSAAPIDGLKVGADYYHVGGRELLVIQEKTGGNLYAQYAMGNFKFGLYKGYLEPGIIAKGAANAADTSTALNGNRYDSSGYGVEFAVNDQLSISDTQEDFERKTAAAIVDGAAGAVKTSVTSTQETIMAAYNIGGATVGLTMLETEDSDYTIGQEENKTILSLGMEF